MLNSSTIRIILKMPNETKKLIKNSALYKQFGIYEDWCGTDMF